MFKVCEGLRTGIVKCGLLSTEYGYCVDEMADISCGSYMTKRVGIRPLYLRVCVLLHASCTMRSCDRDCARGQYV